MPSSFKPGDKFILEIGDRQLDEYENCRDRLLYKNIFT